MPTIQFKISDEDLQDLLLTTGTSTGTKAVAYLIKRYPVLLEEKGTLFDNYQELSRDYEQLADLIVAYKKASSALLGVKFDDES